MTAVGCHILPIYYINSASSAGCPHAQWSRTANPRQIPL